MSTITFDTLKFARRLKEAGVPEKHAEAEADALAEIFELHAKDLSAKGDLQQVKMELSTEIQAVKTELQADMRLLKWMLALVVITTVIPALKSLLG
jgi:hypothetical protein